MKVLTNKEKFEVIKEYRRLYEIWQRARFNDKDRTAMDKITEEHPWLPGFNTIDFLIDMVSDLKLSLYRQNDPIAFDEAHKTLLKTHKSFIKSVSLYRMIWFDENGIRHEGPTACAISAQRFLKEHYNE